MQVPVVRPDGDIELGDAGRHFRTAACAACGGQVLKPDVVFFGDSVPKDRVERCGDLSFSTKFSVSCLYVKYVKAVVLLYACWGQLAFQV